MKKILTLLFIIPCFSISAQRSKLSEGATISLITCGPTQQEVYSAFGHSAFRVQDSVLGIDEVYNYGIFDFNQPHFYLNFAKGYLYYQLGVYNYADFRNAYIYNNRSIREQILNLTPAQLQHIYNYLQWNAQPENQHYLYDYFYNNCSTKLRDVMVSVLKDSVHFDGSYVTSHYTIRELTDFYLTQQHWGDLGIDIGLGLPMDKKITPYEYMFLPDYLESGFDHATIRQNGKDVPLVKDKILVYESRPEETAQGFFQPLYVFILIALIALTLCIIDLKRKKLSTWFDCLLFGSTGLLGWLLILLWFATDHKAAANNLNVLWALPTHLIAVIVFFKQPKWLTKYFLITLIICVMLLITWPVFPQKLHYSLIPLVIAEAVRSFAQFRVRSLHVQPTPSS